MMLRLLLLLALIALAGCSGNATESVDGSGSGIVPMPSAEYHDFLCRIDVRLDLSKGCYYPIPDEENKASTLFRRYPYKVCADEQCFCTSQYKKIQGGVKMGDKTIFADVVIIEEFTEMDDIDTSSWCP